METKRHFSFNSSLAFRVHNEQLNNLKRNGDIPQLIKKKNGFTSFPCNDNLKISNRLCHKDSHGKQVDAKASWKLRYNDLLEYKKEYGHAAIPYRYEKNQKLAKWAKRQRYEYKKWKRGEPTQMTEEKIILLESIGFIWDIHEIMWTDKVMELTEFKNKYHHCNVPRNYENTKLSKWVKFQRQQYKYFMEGKKSGMTPERIVELENLGFYWSLRFSSKDDDNEQNKNQIAF